MYHIDDMGDRRKIGARLEFFGSWPKEFSREMALLVVEETLMLAKGPTGASFGLSVVGDAKMKELNSSYRGQDKVTDVLSFRLSEGESFVEAPEISATELGDVIICLPQVRRQAQAIGRGVDTEMALMVAHGTLHLLGYDHCEAKDEAEMFSLQQEVLMRLNYI